MKNNLAPLKKNKTGQKENSAVKNYTIQKSETVNINTIQNLYWSPIFTYSCSIFLTYSEPNAKPLSLFKHD